MITEDSKTCADLIESELADREEYLSNLFSAIDDNSVDDDSDDAYEQINEMAYGINHEIITKVIWSGGGPADYIEIRHDKDQVYRVDYIYEDWFDSARLTVRKNSAIYRYAVDLIDSLGGNYEN